MKTLFIIHAGADERRVPHLLEQHGVGGYTQIGQGTGAGTSGRLEGTRAWPGQATLWLTIIRDEEAERLMQALRDVKAHLEPGEHLHASLMQADDFI
ncbi:MAG: PG0541 family transporter-associated protein [Gemmatimonadaceae bacterium]